MMAVPFSISIGLRKARWIPAALTLSALIAGCSAPASGPEPVSEATPVPPWDQGDDPLTNPDLPACDTSITVKPDGPALLVNDPAALSGFTLERVLQQIIDRSVTEVNKITPDEMLRRLFDSENSAADGVFPDNMHCDTAMNPAFKNGPAVDCPRAEGALAKSKGLFTPGHPDYFAPIAVVNRFDLTTQGADTCGEYRIVFAKQSGLDDPDNRLFLIFEGALSNPNFNVLNCRKIQAYWHDLEDYEGDSKSLGALLEAFFFTGVEGFGPVVDPESYGLHANEDDPYGSQHGQVRVSQRMQDPWELREFRLRNALVGTDGPKIFFSPATVKNNPMAELFDGSVQTPNALGFREELMNANLMPLSTKGLARIRMTVANTFNAGESALSGAAQTNYVEKGADPTLAYELNQRLKDWGLDKGCPPDDPMTGDAILRRAATQSCAGCHAPERFLGAERKIGCGLVWPSTLGEVHIDETGALSPALQDVFLPRRASVVATILQSCDWGAVYENLQPGGFGGLD